MKVMCHACDACGNTCIRLMQDTRRWDQKRVRMWMPMTSTEGDVEWISRVCF
jgi:hypothetical protein